jgi:hypothetical protein
MPEKGDAAMMYSDNEKKFVIVLNRKIALPQLLNAMGHLAVGMQALALDDDARRFHRYDGADGSRYAEISHWPVIVLQANNGNQLRTLRAGAIAADVPCQAFITAMLGASADDQIQKTKSTEDDKADYVAVMLYGAAEMLQGLTRKFSLFSQTIGNVVDAGGQVANVVTEPATANET